MTSRTRRSGAATEGRAMAQRTHGTESVNITMSDTDVVPGDIFPGSAGSRMSSEIVVTSLTAGAALAVDADVEARVAAGAAGLSMARLAVQHAVRECRGQPFGCRPMVGRQQEGAVQGMDPTTATTAATTTTTADIGFQCDWQTGIGQLVGSVIAMTAGSITSEVRGIVPDPGIHADVPIPVIPKCLGSRIEKGVVRGWRKAAAGRCFTHAMTDGAISMEGDIGNGTMRDRDGQIEIGRTVRRIAVTEGTVEVEGGGRGMAAEAAHADTADAVQVHAMTDGTSRLNIGRCVVEGRVRPGPGLRMSVVGAMAGFTAVAADRDDTDIEPWVAAGAAGLAVAGLAEGQVGLRVRTVVGTAKIAAVQRMGNLAGASGVAASAIEARSEAAGRRLATLQVLAVAGGAGRRAVGRCEAAVTQVGIRPVQGVD